MPKPTIELRSYDELFGGPAVKAAVTENLSENAVVYLPREKLRSYKRHTFQVKNNVSFAELVESIGKYGILEPLIVRRIGAEDEYEIIAGHRRNKGAEINNIEEVPCIIKEMLDKHADSAMVDTNIHRTDDEISHSERAHSYKIKMDAIKSEKASGIAYEKLAEQLNTSRNKVHRYIRLTYLIPELLQLTDEGKIKFLPAVEISYLTPEEQKMLLSVIQGKKFIPSLIQAQQLHQASKNNTFELQLNNMFITNEQKTINFSLKSDTLQRYFPQGTNKKEIEQIIIDLLEKWRQDCK